MNNELKLQAELTMRQLQSTPGADATAIARAFEPLLAAIGKATKQTRKYETKEAR